MTQLVSTDAISTEPIITDDQLALIKKTVAQGATADELQLYFYDCKRRGVHPLDKKIHFTKRGGKYVPITGIDFFREMGARTGACLGVSDATFHGEPGTDDFRATVTIKRLVQGHVAEFTATARWSEYCPPPGQDHMWRKMKHTMLGKCAEVLAWRKFGGSEEMGGLYITEEMDQAKEQTFGEALTQDFPPDTWLKGVLVKALPKAGVMPTQLFIQTEDGTMQFSTLLENHEYMRFIGDAIEYKYGKQGKLRVVTEIRLPGQSEPIHDPTLTVTGAPIPPKEAFPLPLQAPHGEYSYPQGSSMAHPEGSAAQDLADLAMSVSDGTLEQQVDPDDGMPTDSAFFVPSEDTRGVLTGFHQRGTAKHPHLTDLTFECASGTIEVTAWDDPVKKFQVSYEECLDKNVWFRARQGREYKGRQTFNLDFIELYNE